MPVTSQWDHVGSGGGYPPALAGPGAAYPPWWQVVLIELPHVILIPCMIVAYQRRLGFVMILLLFTFFSSIFYHLCRGTGWSIFENTSLLTWTQIDYINAYAQAEVEFYMLAINPNSDVIGAYLRKVFGPVWFNRQLFWEPFLVLAMFGFGVIVVLTNITDYSATYSIKPFLIFLTFLCYAWFVKVVMVDQGRALFFRKFDPYLALGSVVSIIVGAVFFMYDAGSATYWQYHSYWHAFVFFGILLSELANTAYIGSKFKDLVHNVLEDTVYNPLTIVQDGMACDKRK